MHGNTNIKFIVSCHLSTQTRTFGNILYDAVYRNFSLMECNVMQYRRFDGPSNLHHHSCEILNAPHIRRLVVPIKASLLLFNVYLNLDNWHYFILSRHEAALFSLCLQTCVECFDSSSFVLTSHLKQLSCIWLLYHLDLLELTLTDGSSFISSL